jgi:uncharacterized protein YcnI
MDASQGWRRAVGCTVLLLMSLSTLSAHIDIEPKETIPGRWETFVLNVPTETESPTVEVQLDIP